MAFYRCRFVPQTIRSRTYRYLKFIVSEVRGANNDSQYIQLSKLEFTNSNSEIYSYPAGTTINGNLTPVSGSEVYTNLIDGSTGTKLCASWDKTTGLIITIDLGTINPIDVNIYNIFNWYTANDAASFPERNPLSWELYGANESDFSDQELLGYYIGSRSDPAPGNQSIGDGSGQDISQIFFVFENGVYHQLEDSDDLLTVENGQSDTVTQIIYVEEEPVHKDPTY